jgi:hypothetical protein
MATASARLERWSDRIPPVLLREVRQSLRGRVFRLVFLLVLTAGIVAAIAVAAVGEITLREPTEIGRDLFDLLVGGLFLTCLVQVPFSAFQSLAAEWDDDTYELLALSNLRPRRIVAGKLLGALLQSMLHVCALTPGIVFCFLLRGVGLLEIALLIGGILILGTTYSAIGIALASLSRLRVVRGMLLAVFVLLVVFVSIGLNETVRMELLFRGSSSTEVLMLGTMLLACSLGLVFLGLEVAAARLAHAEENRSTGVRCVVAATILALFAWLQVMLMTFGYDSEPAVYASMAFATLGALFAGAFVTERDSLGRRARIDTPRSPLLAGLLAPLLPGGARGLLFAALLLGGALAYGCGVMFFKATAMRLDVWVAADLLLLGPVWIFVPQEALRNFGQDESAPFVLLLWVSYLWLMLSGGRALARLWPASLRGLSMFTPLFLALLVLVVPMFVGLVLGAESLRDGEHAGNPIWIIDQLDDQPEEALTVASVLILLAASSFLWQLRGMTRSVREVVDASRRPRAPAQFTGGARADAGTAA